MICVLLVFHSTSVDAGSRAAGALLFVSMCALGFTKAVQNLVHQQQLLLVGSCSAHHRVVCQSCVYSTTWSWWLVWACNLLNEGFDSAPSRGIMLWQLPRLQ